MVDFQFECQLVYCPFINNWTDQWLSLLLCTTKIMSRITYLAIIGLLIHVCQGAISTGSFKLMTMPSSIWPPYVIKTVDVPVGMIDSFKGLNIQLKCLVSESRQECASYCMSETTCHGLVMEGDVCWIVDLMNNNNVIGTQTSTRVYVKEGKWYRQHCK